MAGRVTVQLALLAALAACHNDHPTTPHLAPASSVTFTLPTTHFVVGDSALATARVLDANGVVIDSAPIVWSSLHTDVATVSNYGEIYGKGPGIARIVAKSGAVADTVSITVDTKAAIAIDSMAPKALIAGQPATIYGHQFSSIPTATVLRIGVDSLAPTSADSTHLVFVLPDTSCSPAGTRTVTVKSRGSTAAVIGRFAPGSPPVSMPVGGVQSLPAGCIQFASNPAAASYVMIVSEVTGSLNTPFSFQLTQSLGDSAPLGFGGYSRIRPSLAHRFSAPGKSARKASVQAVEHAVVGDAVTYNVPINGCDSAVVTNGHVMAVGTHTIVAQDDAASGDGLTSSDFATIAANVDATVYPVDIVHFGSPSDIDGNGRVILYYTSQVSTLTTGDAAIVGGFFFRGDLFPTSTCKASNQAEILYLAPNAPGGAIAHVLEHLINAGNHIRTNSDAFEEPWLDEGLAHAAEDFVGRAADGYTDMQRLAYTDLTNGSSANAYTTYFQGNVSRYYSNWLAAPQAVGGADTTADTSAAARGAAWSLLRYTFDQYANGSPATLSHALAAGPATGIYNLVSATGTPLDSLIKGWLVANYATGFGVAGVAPHYTFTSYNWQDIGTAISGTFQLSQTPFAAGAAGVADNVQANTGFYLQMVNPAPTGAFSVRVLTPTGAVVTLPGARIYLLRTQ